MMHLVLLLLLWLKTANTAAASLRGGITFDVALVGSTKIQFTITASSSGWVGFGYGTCMWSNDMFVIEASGGTGTISDMTMSGHSYPNMDTVNDYTLTTSTSGSTNTYVVTRLLSDGDSKDYQFSSGTTNIVYAWGSGSMSNHGSSYGSFSINLSIVYKICLKFIYSIISYILLRHFYYILFFNSS